MAWNWYEIDRYNVSVGHGNLYGAIELFADEFWAHIRFHEKGPLPNSSEPTQKGKPFYGHLEFQQMPMIVDLLRNEKPVRFGWCEGSPNAFLLTTGREPVGEGDGLPEGGISG